MRFRVASAQSTQYVTRRFAGTAAKCMASPDGFLGTQRTVNITV
jgi:hypothetical protein